MIWKGKFFDLSFGDSLEGLFCTILNLRKNKISHLSDKFWTQIPGIQDLFRINKRRKIKAKQFFTNLGV